jgi:hypothetical protein
MLRIFSPDKPDGVSRIWTRELGYQRKHYLFTYLLTPWSKVLVKLTGLWLVKKFPAFYGTRKFITAFTSARYLSLSWASSIQSVPPHPNSWRSSQILSAHLRLGLPSGVFPSGFPTQTLYTPLPFPVRAACRYCHLFTMKVLLVASRPFGAVSKRKASERSRGIVCFTIRKYLGVGLLCVPCMTYRVIRKSLWTSGVRWKNSVYSNNPHAVGDLKMAITEFIRNADRAVLTTVFENTVRRVHKCLETGGGQFEHYL